MIRMRSFAVVALLVLALSAWPAAMSAQEELPVRGATYVGQLSDTTGECSRGNLTIGEDIDFLTSEYGRRIIGIGLTGLSYSGSGLSIVPQSFMLNVSIPVDGNGAFNQDFSQYGVDTHIQGRFEGDGLSGSLRSVVGGVTECEGTFTALAAAPFREEQTFKGVLDEFDECGGGTVTFTRSADLHSILSTSVAGFHTEDGVASGSATFAPGTVPVDAESGTFEWLYFPGRTAGQEIAVSGTFFNGLMSGAVTVSPSSCGMVHFDAYRFVIVEDPGLPNVGGGPGHASGGALWLSLLVAIAGATLVASGLAIRRRG